MSPTKIVLDRCGSKIYLQSTATTLVTKNSNWLCAHRWQKNSENSIIWYTVRVPITHRGRLRASGVCKIIRAKQDNMHVPWPIAAAQTWYVHGTPCGFSGIFSILNAYWLCPVHRIKYVGWGHKRGILLLPQSVGHLTPLPDFAVCQILTIKMSINRVSAPLYTWNSEISI